MPNSAMNRAASKSTDLASVVADEYGGVAIPEKAPGAWYKKRVVLCAAVAAFAVISTTVVHLSKGNLSNNSTALARPGGGDKPTAGRNDEATAPCNATSLEEFGAFLQDCPSGNVFLHRSLSGNGKSVLHVPEGVNATVEGLEGTLELTNVHFKVNGDLNRIDRVPGV